MSGEMAVALRSAGAWALKEICPENTGSYALAVRSGAGWAFAPYGTEKDGRYLALASPAGRLLVPLACDEDEPCTGDDPLCSVCPCESDLHPSYQVSISGFPAICGVDAFNGSWNLEWRSDCLWQYDIDATRSVRLMAQAGPFWLLHWAQNDGSISIGGYYGGQGGAPCAPETQSFQFWQAFTMPYCPGLSTMLYYASIVIRA